MGIDLDIWHDPQLMLKVFAFGIIAVGIILLATNPFPILTRYFAWKNGTPKPNCKVMRTAVMINITPEVMLETAHYFPSDADLTKQQYPTLMSRSPYGISAKHGVVGFFLQLQAHYFASLGYHVILQNTRARFGSTGVWEPMVNEEHDGKKTLHWLKSQPWFNGKLGCFGAAYGAFTQLTLFGYDSPILPNAVTPAVTGTNFYNTVYFNTSMDLFTTILWHIGTRHSNMRFFQAYLSFFTESSNKLAKNIYDMSMHVPLLEADREYLGEELPLFRQMLTTTNEDDEFWRKRDISSVLEIANGEVFHIMAGWYDTYVTNSLSMYSKFVARGQQPYLTVFNQDHGGEGFQHNWAYILPWFEHKLKGKEGREHPVHVEVGPGSGNWLHLDHWPPLRSETYFYLSPEGQLAYIPTREEHTFEYTYDPERPTPYLAGNVMKNGGCVNNLPFLLDRQQNYKDVALFTSPPFYTSAIITGTVIVTLFVSSSLENTDFFVRLLDFDQKKNVGMNICDGFMRMTPTTHPPKDERGVYMINIELSPTAYKINQDHALMLQVASGAHPFRSRNPGTGEPIHLASTFVKAEQKVFAAPYYASRICLPTLLT